VTRRRKELPKKEPKLTINSLMVKVKHVRVSLADAVNPKPKWLRHPTSSCLSKLRELRKLRYLMKNNLQ